MDLETFTRIESKSCSYMVSDDFIPSNGVWCVEIEFEDGHTEEFEFSRGNPDKHPFEIYEDSFDSESEQYEDVDLPENEEYWVLDLDDELSDDFHRVPTNTDSMNPTMFVAVPKNQVIDTYFESDCDNEGPTQISVSSGDDVLG